jgi:AcrR family transcriptional regulator
VTEIAQPITGADENDPVSPAPSSRRAGRPPRRVLSRELITRAALQLLEDAGYDRFTMAGLARALEVAPSALYNHVESKRDVLLWVQDHLMGFVDAGDFGRLAWDEALRAWAWSYRDVFALHAPLIPVIAVMPVGGATDTLRMYEDVARGLIDGGWPEDRVVPTIVAVESFIYGSAMDVSAPDDIFDAGSLAEDFPVFTAAVRSSRSAGHRSQVDDAFGSGLTAMITGMREYLRTRSF